MVGCGVLTTVTTKLQVAPDPVWELTGVEPTAKKEPDAGLDVIPVPQSPEASGPKVTIAPGWFCALTAFVPTVILSGQIKVHVGGFALLPLTVTAESLLSVRGSTVELPTVALFESESCDPFGRLLLTVYTAVNTAVSPGAISVFVVQVVVPALPTDGLVQLNVAGV